MHDSCRYQLKFFGILLVFLIGIIFPLPAAAASQDKLGIHIMHIDEILLAGEFMQNSELDRDQWRYVTVPLVLSDLKQFETWQKNFRLAKKYKLRPIVRLATEFKNNAWQVPTMKDVVDQLEFLSKLEWPDEKRTVIAYNEVNHAAEWGGKLDPQGYADTLQFVLAWAHSEPKRIAVLPAALDLDAPNTDKTRRALEYWQYVYEARPELFAELDGWNSHSYPNPGFIGSPRNSGLNSINGYVVELSWVDQLTSQKLPVYITETGWRDTLYTGYRLSSNYEYALNYVWSNDRVKAVTPFVLKSQPGPFAEFSFLNELNLPTRQHTSLFSAIKRINAREESSAKKNLN